MNSWVVRKTRYQSGSPTGPTGRDGVLCFSDRLSGCIATLLHHLSSNWLEITTVLDENLVGRSRSFWDRFFPQAQTFFPGALQHVAKPDFFAAINDVRPSLIRVEADEATYNLHIVIRFELEKAVMQGELETDDLPAAWNAKYQEFLGIEPESPVFHANGVMQDIHWSAGLIG